MISVEVFASFRSPPDRFHEIRARRAERGSHGIVERIVPPGIRRLQRPFRELIAVNGLNCVAGR